tara:strand:- start:1133 stop:1369 length:237 start_codon:yes stop_codon:yes gene_type:complete
MLKKAHATAKRDFCSGIRLERSEKAAGDSNMVNKQTSLRLSSFSKLIMHVSPASLFMGSSTGVRISQCIPIIFPSDDN